MKKTIAAFALTAALAMGAAPAFADVPADGNTALGDATSATTAAEGGSASGNTTVSVKTVAMNISAKVPITMTVAAPAEGGVLTVPENYQMTNGSVYPISVKVKADMTDMKWTLTQETATSLPDANKINLKLQPAGVDAAFSVNTTDSAEWKIAEKGADADTACAIAVSGSASKTALKVGEASAAVKLVYTIAPTTIETPPAP